MTGFPPLHFALVQGLLVGLVMLAPPLLLAFASRFKVGRADILLFLPVLPVFAALTIVVFLPFDGAWADRAFGPLFPLRSLIVGGVAVLLGMALTQRKNLARRSAVEVAQRLGAGFLIGAVWGVVWSLSGWFLHLIGMANNG